MRARPHNTGFTLIELSVVLVVIALVIGGILVGNDLIKIAQVRMQIAQIEKLNTAVNTFKNKYQCLPGDCRDAVEFELGTSGGDGDNGDGDGFIETGTFPGAVVGIETQNFWYHLGHAELIEGNFPLGVVPGINSPPLVMPGSGIEGNLRGGVWVVDAFENIFDGGTTTFSSHTWLLTTRTDPGVGSYAGVYYADAAYMMDAKMDDGYPASGIFQISNGPNGLGLGASLHGVNNVATVSSGWPDACYDDTPPFPYIYNINPASFMAAQWARLCMPIIKASF